MEGFGEALAFAFYLLLGLLAFFALAAVTLSVLVLIGVL